MSADLLLSETHEQPMAAVQGGDSSALGELFNRHHGALYRYFLRMPGSASLSEDLTPEVFLRVLRKSETWQRDTRFASWMYRIAYNAFIDHTRSECFATSRASSAKAREILQGRPPACLRPLCI